VARTVPCQESITRRVFIRNGLPGQDSGRPACQGPYNWLSVKEIEFLDQILTAPKPSLIRALRQHEQVLPDPARQVVQGSADHCPTMLFAQAESHISEVFSIDTVRERTHSRPVLSSPEPARQMLTAWRKEPPPQPP
jgi:hypothetical protein